jgi:phosphonate transport system substrate-binding protein
MYILLINIICFCINPLQAAANSNKDTYTIAIVPQFASTQVYRDWSPLLTLLEQKTGLHFKLKVYDEFPGFENDFSRGVPDLVFLNPYHMVIAQKKQGYRPLVRDSGILSGILLVKQDGSIKKLKDLQEKSIAFPTPNALAASLYIRALLTKKIHIKFNPVYVNGHQNVYRQILLDNVAAGGGTIRTLEKEPEAIRAQLKILYTTPDMASHPLAANPRVSVSAGNRISAALIAMSHEEEGKKLLTAILMPNPVAADYKRDYSGLSKLKLDRYVVTQPK